MIDQVTAHHLFEYRNGHLYWKNAVLPSNNGKLAGYDNKNGYKKVTIKNKQYYITKVKIRVVIEMCFITKSETLGLYT